MPGARKPDASTVARIERLRTKLEAQPMPAWFADAIKPHASSTVSSSLADKIGDAEFERQKATPEYQARKALALVYLAEHELDKPDAATKAGMYLSILGATHPWDWEVHNLYSRLLLDARLNQPAWNAARLGLFLNPRPNVDDLQYFAFVGSIADRGQWPEIQQAIKDAAPVTLIADQAIAKVRGLYGPSVKALVVPPKSGKNR